jgi:glycosyltransferase involved in cell wall biosynthesis
MKGVWQWNKEARLVLAGPQADRQQQVDAFIASLTEFERKRIVLIDDFPDQEKASIFDAFDIFVMPSTAESFGIAYLEAWMLRKAVIGARIGPTRCVIDEGSDECLCQSGVERRKRTESIVAAEAVAFVQAQFACVHGQMLESSDCGDGKETPKASS